MTALAIARNDLKRLAREPVALFWIFVGPLIFTTFFGILFKPQPRKPVALLLVDHDEGRYIADALSALLKSDDLVVRRAEAAPAGQWALEIPAGSAAARVNSRGNRRTHVCATGSSISSAMSVTCPV